MHLLYTFGVGGMEVGITKLVNSLDRSKVVSSICSCRPADALKEYEASQVREPNRLRGYYGAGLAASQAGQQAKAKQHYTRLVALAGKGEARPEVAAARTWLGAN